MTNQELANEINQLTEVEIAKINAHLDVPIGIVIANSDTDLEDLAEEINNLSVSNYDAFVALVDNGGTRKGSRRPC